jgi:hypothetical protein
MPCDAIYDDLFSDYLALSLGYTEAVVKLSVFQKELDHSSFAKTALLARRLAAQVETAREAAKSQRLAS